MVSIIPSWLQAAAAYAVAFTTIATFIALVVRYVKGARRLHENRVKNIIRAEVRPILHELSPNSGASLRDQTNRIEDTVFSLQGILLSHVQDPLLHNARVRPPVSPSEDR